MERELAVIKIFLVQRFVLLFIWVGPVMSNNIHQSAIMLKALTGNLRNIDYLVTMAPVSGVGYIRQQINSQFFKLMCWKHENGQV